MKYRLLQPTLGPAFAAIVMAIASGSSFAQEQCNRPYQLQVPDAVPDTKDQMLEIQGEVKDYLAEAEEYLACSEAEMDELSARRAGVEDAGVLEEIERELQIMLNRYNGTVEEMHEVGERFNELVARFREQASGD